MDTIEANSYMDVLLELKDADSEEVIHKKVLSTKKSDIDATWIFNVSDRSLPSDFGILIGEYIFRIVPSIK